MTEPMSIEKIAEELGVNFHDLHPLITTRENWLIERAKQEGRKGVVEWLEKQKMYRYALIAGGRKEETFDIFIKCEMLQAKKEEWGI